MSEDEECTCYSAPGYNGPVSLSGFGDRIWCMICRKRYRGAPLIP